MFNNLGIFSNNFGINRTPIIRRGFVTRRPAIFRRAPVVAGLEIGGIGNDIINIGTGIIGPPGPPGPPGTPGLVPVTEVIETPYDVLLTDYVLAVNVDAPVSIVFPVSPVGTVFVVKDADGDASVNPITITASTTIDGAASFVINIDYGSNTFVFNGTEWNVI